MYVEEVVQNPEGYVQEVVQNQEGYVQEAVQYQEMYVEEVVQNPEGYDMSRKWRHTRIKCLLKDGYLIVLP